MIKLASEDYNNCITLHKNVDLQNDFTKVIIVHVISLIYLSVGA